MKKSRGEAVYTEQFVEGWAERVTVFYYSPVNVIYRISEMVELM